LAERLAEIDRAIEAGEGTVDELQRRAVDLTVEIAGAGGDRLTAIEAEMKQCESLIADRRARRASFNELMGKAGLEPVASGEQFARASTQVVVRREQLDQAVASAENLLNEKLFETRELESFARQVNSELSSLRGRASNIPAESLELRARMCDDLQYPAAELPFAGELIQVRADAMEWEGAAERVLRNFGLSLLVPNDRYEGVAQWINDHHMNTRVVYFRVPAATTGRTNPERRTAHPLLLDMLEVKADSGFRAWLESELARRADHACVDAVSEFRLVTKAVTRAGQFKDRDRHEKDDRHRLDDRRRYVLGWDNRLKLEALIAEGQSLQARQATSAKAIAGARGEKSAVDAQLHALASLCGYDSWTALDWEEAVNRSGALKAEMDRLLESSDLLAALKRELVDVNDRTTVVGSELRALERERGAVEGEIGRDQAGLADAEAVLASVVEPAAPETTTAIEALVAEELDASELTVAGLSSVQRALSETLNRERSRHLEIQQRIGQRVIGFMSDFRTKYPQETLDFDVSLESADEYRQLNRRLVEDDLPRFESNFKEYLNQNTIRDIASFHAQLNKHEQTIRDRIAKINQSLFTIDYNEGRYIVLVPDQTPNTEIREFRAELRSCTDNIVGADQDEQYSEQRFLQVKRILDRFKGREGFADLDRKWTQRVTDVRQWFVFSASERWRDSDVEFEHYADSAGKSGGQKEKLAYTILAASLAYQFKLDWGARQSKAFRFVVIDEAFSRGSEASTRYALGLFTQLGLQLLIVTPLQKIHVIEPYVAAVGFVDNPSGSYSRLQSLTIAEFRRRKVEAVAGMVGVDRQAP
jgi:uncharacterized protein YPO0396